MTQTAAPAPGTFAHANTYTIPAAARPLAALLPARRGRAWTVEHPRSVFRPGAPTAALTDGVRTLYLVENAGRLEVFTAEFDPLPEPPALIVDGTEPDPIAEVAAGVLRSVLPLVDNEIAANIARTHGWMGALTARMDHLREFGYALAAHGITPEPGSVAATAPGLIWTAGGGGTWGLSMRGLQSNLRLNYYGPLSGLYGLLPHLLPPHQGPALPDASSVTTRGLIERFPQLRPAAEAGAAWLPGHPLPGGHIVSLADKGTPVDDATRVAAEFDGIGVDLLIAAAAHLI
ncbi:hypothetical protein ACIP9H_34110 [Streptomyces sp. NPDC088732]|uniref:hypothetical protein n=1 Tax=Streptomyces sp. NPDC088732 TaxID=3365879 RepID=UPI00380071BF